MERSRDHGDLAATLAEVRPAPRAAFTEELDERVAAGFPRRSRFAGSPLAGIANWIARLTPERLLFGGGTAALAAIAVATVIVTSGDSGRSPATLEQIVGEQGSGGQLLGGFKPFSDSAGPQLRAGNSAGSEDSTAEGLSSSAGSARLSRGRGRDIERSAEIGLLADPADVADDSAAVFAAVPDARGIVLHSTTTSGERAAANFDLLIPSAQLGDALAAFSAIDEVRSRHEATDDITAPTVSAREELQDSRARIDTLLAQLAAAETESEALAVETELRSERRHAARLRAQLANLDRRTTYSRVSVRIESDAAASPGGAWGFDDAIGDAGRILGVAAAITLIGLAILTPIALLCLLVWLARRTWLRHARARALG